MKALFGPAGNSDDFYKSGGKTTAQMMAFIGQMGLTAYEYQCGRGVNITEKTAAIIAGEAKKAGVALSLHTPYFISLASADEQKRINSIKYIADSAKAVDMLGGERIVVHPGGLNKFTRSEAADKATLTLKQAQDNLDETGLGHIRICPETMGKMNQLGDLDEVLRFCLIDERFIPCIDFGHLNSRTGGHCQTKDEVCAVFDTVENILGAERLKGIHVHFSKIEYSAGGEVRHLTFEDETFGPDYRPLIEETVRRDIAPVFICESSGTQSIDALCMSRHYAGAKSARE